ncbi:hypothetical protein EDC94DRAFT_640181 [Helicostylum pulchrum]|nr:hypothetical protein EDC94DRAFT_640181 [Helicostylum pulchrum]
MRGMHSALASPNLNSSHTSRSGSPFPSLPSSPPLSSADDVTTIFVVGFPDDMQEREFQNMFMFAKGFEAASLKWHRKDQQEDQDMCHDTLNNKKQMIGFARFRTRHEAVEATNEINGKKIDMEKGCILKAEMAKKNLHIKRAMNPSTTATPANNLLLSAVQLPEHSSSPMTILTRGLSHAQPDRSQSNSMDYESFLPLPSDLLSPTRNYKHDPFQLNDTAHTPSFNDSLFCIRSHSYDGPNQNYQDDTNTITPFQFFSKSELDTDPFHYMSKSTPVPHHDSTAHHHNIFNHQVEDLALNGRKNSVHTIERSSSALSNSFRTACSANQNPPCNTLYVGNLPPSTSEDELRSLFETCEGYKRMCFRNKPQGPMCFVEFEDVVYATQAMNEHQGHLLSNSVKGGIRLSFSKNPLFIKPSKEADISFNFKQMGTALLADL